MEKNVNKNIAGVSLIEIMISLVLVAIALIAITSTFPNINKTRKGIQEADQAKFIATEVLEGLQYLTIEGECKDPIDWGCTTLSSCPEMQDCKDFAETKYPKTGSDVVVGIVTYTVTWSVPTTAANWGGKTVDVTVSWTKGNKPHNVKVTGAL
jgi:type II secretory pathway pseudopilin PulG